MCILGPLELRRAGKLVPLGGAKQRAVLALLLLQAEEIVPVERLIDELWGEEPPPSAAHSLEAYVSRLRQLLEQSGMTLLRRGGGYVLRLGEARLDARSFDELHAAAADAAAEGDDDRASALAADALALWHGDALADVPLGAWGRVEVERLEERRLLLFEQRADADLRLGRHEDLVGELQALVRHNPYRERLVTLLMLSLYRSGRHADALDVYEQTRNRLAGDLGLQPSAELQQLSGQIVRQSPELLPASRRDPPAVTPPARVVRWSALLAGAIATSIVALAASGSVRQVADAAPVRESTRVALVLPRAPAGDDAVRAYRSRLSDYLYFDKTLSVKTLVADDVGDATSAIGRDNKLVLWVGDGPVARSFARHVRALPQTRFVFLDASLETLGLRGVPNATAVRFAEEESSELGGYMSALVETRSSSARADIVSAIVGGPPSRARRIADGFRRGIRKTDRRVRVVVAYVPEGADRIRCEQLANAQIDGGSDVVFIAAGRCGSGASAVARIRNVWAIDAEGAFERAEHLLVQTYKERLRGVDMALAGFQSQTLPAGRDIVLGLKDDYAVGIAATNDAVPAWISSAVVRLCSSIRAHSAAS